MTVAREFKFVEWTKVYKCTMCENFYSWDKFWKNKKWLDWLQSRCKWCMSKTVVEYMRKNKDKRNEYQRWYWKNRTWYTPQPQQQQSQPEPTPTPQTISSPQDDDTVNFENAFPDAYAKIMSDQDMKEAYERWSYDYKIEYLTDMQDKINKKKEEEKFKENVKKFRQLAEQAYTEDWVVDEAKMQEIEETVKSFALEKDKERYINAMVKFSPISFKLSWKNVYEDFSWLKE